jgi:hypothetical protein
MYLFSIWYPSDEIFDAFERAAELLAMSGQRFPQIAQALSFDSTSLRLNMVLDGGQDKQKMRMDGSGWPEVAVYISRLQCLAIEKFRRIDNGSCVWETSLT